MKGYKAFEKGMICRGKQYVENSIFEEGKAEICQSGMHFCKNPLDVLDYYPVVDNNGNMTEFAEVEALDDCETDDNKKYCTKKLKIFTKISFSTLVQASVNFELEKMPTNSKVKVISKKDFEHIGLSGYSTKIGSSGYSAYIGSSGDSAQIASSGDSAQIGSSGDYAKIGSSGEYAKIGSSGCYAQIGSSGDFADIGSSGVSAQIGSSGDSAQIGSSGDYAKIGSSGEYAQICSSGYYTKIGSSGEYAQIVSSGYYAQIVSSGDYAHIGSSGDYAQIGSSGDSAHIASSGYYVKIESTGKYAVVCCAGNNSVAKAKIGSWITLSEWKKDEKDGIWKPICVKTEQVDGKKIKEDTFYKLKNGKFVECKG